MNANSQPPTPNPQSPTPTTLDGLLNHRVTLEQPAKGYRVAVDTVLLAAAVPAKAGDKVLEFGCGVGGAMLCLAARVPSITITGIEIQPELVELCRRNIARNAFGDRLNVIEGDVTQETENLSSVLRPLSSDHLIMNPPYHDEARHDVSPDNSKRAANTAKTGDLARWIDSAARALKPSGTLTLIHRADCLNEILEMLKTAFGEIKILPIVSVNTLTKRIIIMANKDKLYSTTTCRSLILHKTEGGYTDEAEAVLRHAKPLEFVT